MRCALGAGTQTALTFIGVVSLRNPLQGVCSGNPPRRGESLSCRMLLSMPPALHARVCHVSGTHARTRVSAAAQYPPRRRESLSCRMLLSMPSRSRRAAVRDASSSRMRDRVCVRGADMSDTANCGGNKGAGRCKIVSLLGAGSCLKVRLAPAIEWTTATLPPTTVACHKARQCVQRVQGG